MDAVSVDAVSDNKKQANKAGDIDTGNNVEDNEAKKAVKSEKNENNDKKESDGPCTSINDCSSMKSISSILKFYENLKNQDDIYNSIASIVEYFDKHQYTSLINDYHHILMHHLNAEKPSQNTENFDGINKYLLKDIKCDITSCESFVRNGRNREEEMDKDEKSDYDKHGVVYIDILDTIHSFFIHAYDSGHRIKIKTKDDDTKTNECDSSIMDTEMSSILAVISAKQQELQAIDIVANNEKNRFNSHKYLTMSHIKKINEDMIVCDGYLMKESKYLKTKRKRWMVLKRNYLYSYKNNADAVSDPTEVFDLTLYDKVKVENNMFNLVSTTGKTKNRLFVASCNDEMVRWVACLKNIIESNDTDEDQKEQKEEEEQKYATQHQHGFGYRFYYWPWYEKNDDLDKNGNVGYKFSDWFVKQFYADFKEEITTILSMSQFIFITNKATKMLQESEVLKSKQCESEGKNYDIKKESKLSIPHLMTIILYTDYNQFIEQFTKTFDKLTVDESDQELKQRHSKYANTSKLMRETVELFGTSWYSWKPWYWDEAVIPCFYRAASFMYFTSLIMKFSSPTSVTRQLCVATRFASIDGLVLELGQCAGSFWKPSYFNCSLVSCYGVEDERVFLGGGPAAYILLDGIRNIGTKENYSQTIRAMQMFQNMIRGSSLTKQEAERFSKDGIEESLIIQQLIKNQNTQKVDCNYIHLLFQKFVDQQSFIKIKTSYIREHYYGFSDFPSFVKICNVFVNCKKIRIDYHDSDLDGLKELSMGYWTDIIKELLNVYDANHKIKRIELQNVTIDYTERDKIFEFFNGQQWNYQLKKSDTKIHHMFTDYVIYTDPSYIEQEKLEKKEEDCSIM